MDLALGSCLSRHLIGSKCTSLSFCEHVTARVEEGDAHHSGIMVEGDALKVLEVKTSSPLKSILA